MNQSAIFFTPKEKLLQKKTSQYSYLLLLMSKRNLALGIHLFDFQNIMLLFYINSFMTKREKLSECNKTKRMRERERERDYKIPHKCFPRVK